MAPDTLSLEGKTAIITGSGRENGIGAAIARAFARNGAAVCIHYVSESTAPRAAKVADQIREIGGKVTVVSGDIGKPETAQKIVAATLEAFGVDRIDILVNNAAVVDAGSLMALTPERLQAQFEVNVFGPLYMTQAVVSLGKMPSGDRIMNIGSVASKLSSKANSIPVYSATKAADDLFTEAWAEELGRSRGITVNMLAPGPVETDIAADASSQAGTSTAAPFLEMARGADRIGRPEDIADAALLIASEKFRWITAQYISLSAGITGTM